MKFVDKQNNLSRRVFNLFQHRFQAVFKFTSVFRSCQHGSEIKCYHALVLQNFRYVAGDDALRQTFHNGGLANARLSDKHGIILGTAGEHLHNPADLFITSNHRIELAFAGLLGEVASVTLECLILGFRILVSHLL